MKNEDQFLLLVSKVLSDQATEEEVEQLNEWIKQSGTHEESFRIFSDIWKKTRLKRNSNRIESAFSRLNDRILLQEESRINERSGARLFRDFVKEHFTSMLTAAAVVFLVLASVLTFYFTGNPHEDIKTKWVTKYNPAGQKSKILLQDGTIVWLNSASKLVYEKSFNDTCRSVDLEGEAYFEVAKDNFRPFKVHSKDLTTTVLGTSFNIRSFPEDSLIAVSLVEGKVHLDLPYHTQGAKSFILTPGEKLVFSKKSYKTQFGTIDPGLDFGWKDGLLVFREAGFSEVVDRLSVWYGVQFEVFNKAPGNWNYSGEFKNSTLEHVLEVLSYVEEFNFQLKSDKVIIKFKNAYEK